MFTDLIPIAYASVDTFIRKVNKFIINPIIVLLFIIAIVYFVYGLTETIAKGGDPSARERGRRHMIWGIVGALIMVSAYFIFDVIMGTLGIDNIDPENLEVDIDIDG